MTAAGPVLAGPADAACVIVGQAPGRRSDPTDPLAGAWLQRLARAAGLSDAALRAVARRATLLSAWPGRAPGDSGVDAWDAPAGRTAAGRLAPELIGRRVVLLGRHVAGAFGLPGSLPWGACVKVRVRPEDPGGPEGEFLALLLPHPSGVSHAWTVPACRLLAGAYLRAFLDGAPIEGA